VWPNQDAIHVFYTDTEENLAGESAEFAIRSHVNRVTATEIRSCDTVNIGYFPEHCSLLTLL